MLGLTFTTQPVSFTERGTKFHPQPLNLNLSTKKKRRKCKYVQKSDTITEKCFSNSQQCTFMSSDSSGNASPLSIPLESSTLLSNSLIICDIFSRFDVKSIPHGCYTVYFTLLTGHSFNTLILKQKYLFFRNNITIYRAPSRQLIPFRIIIQQELH